MSVANSLPTNGLEPGQFDKSDTMVNSSFLAPGPNGFSPPSPSPSSATEGDQQTHEPEHQSHPIPPEVPHGQEADGPQSRAHAKIRTWGDEWETRRFPRLAKPVEVMRHSYDTVVIGSGYGGGVAASRMARAGKHVCVLERGKERWPGEYPVSAGDALSQLHVSGEFSPKWLPGIPVDGGDPTGMYHLILGKGQNAVVGNGLGGTSLMNANVFLEADKDTLAMKVWPAELRKDPGELDKYYKRAASVLEPETYPEDWPRLPKLELLEQQAEALGMEGKFRRVAQTTRFRNGPNSMGVEMKPSALTGQDCTGVNDGSKNTTLVTYIADAWNWGAEMFCECEVRYIEKAVGREGWMIYFAWHGRNRAHFKANLHGDLMWVHAKEAVFLGAGALGTTEILLRSRDMGLNLSNHVGLNMSGNGDILAFGYNTDHEVNSMGRAFPSPYNPIGPCITGIIDNRTGHDNPLDGYVIEEGTMPSALAPFLQAMLDLLPGSVEPKGETVFQQAQAALQRYGSRFLGPYFKDGAMEKTQVYLIMSHDSNQAALTLKDDRPVLEFLGVGRSHYVKELNAVLERATNAVGGTLVQNPFYALFGEQQVTVHPIGGASMARDGTGATGVTNDRGEVFVGNTGEVHDGLLVTDGALVPTALGANPFATITALAERVLEKYCEKKSLKINWDKNGLLNLFDEPQRAPDWTQEIECRAEVDGVTVEEQKTIDRFKAEDKRIQYVTSLIDGATRAKKAGFGFTEVMSGFLHREHGMVRDEKSVYELAYRTAKNQCESARFFLSVQSFDTRALVKEPDHSALLTGTFVCPTIPGSPFMVHRGDFNLFLMNTEAPGTRNLTYDFDMTGVDGKLVHFHGYKVVDSSVALSPIAFWKATSTLYVTVTRIPDEYELGDSEGKSGSVSLGERRRLAHDQRCSCGKAWRHDEVLAKGMMNIQPADFASEVLTMTPTGSNILKKIWSATSFLTYFTRKSLSLFLTPFSPLQYPSTTYTGYINDTPPTASYAIVASDGVTTRMHMWEPTYLPEDREGKKVEAKNLFMIPGAAVDHQIYALPTIPYNAVNYFRRAGYRCFVSVHRIGQLVVAQNQHTTYDARLDLRADLEYIRKHFNDGDEKRKVYTIAHCMGSVAFSTGLLDGTIPADWILGVSCSQVFMNPIWNTGNMLKIKLGIIPADVLYKKLAGDWFSCSTSPDDTFVQRALNELLRVWPDERAELCNNASCHRCTLVFGRCWNHRNLNEATHRQIDRFFGGVNITLLHLLMKQGHEGHVMTNEPVAEALDTVENVQRLEGLPFLLFVGGDNAVLSPESTQRTYEVLCDAFGRSTEGQNGVLQYRRRVVPGYGHLDCWMGRNAWKDVYPFVREEVDRVVRGETFKFVEPDDKFKRMVENGELLY